MFCIHCGANNDADDKFCVNCGAPMSAPEPESAPAQTAEAPAAATSETPVSAESTTESTTTAEAAQPDVPAAPAAPAVPAITPEPAVAPQSMQTPSTPPAGEPAQSGTTAAAKPRRGWVKPVAITVTLAVLATACGLGAYLTWRQGLWGGTLLPQESSFTVQAGQQLTADVVADQLKSKGVKVEKQQIFSGKPKGAFVGYDNLKPGDRVQKDQTVTVQESAGPGVPQGTVGKSASDAVESLKDMGVPVTAKEVVVSDDSQYAEGDVVVTSPADGQALPEDQQSDGIFVGVATKGDGVPFDIIGKDVDETRQALTKQGFSVTVVNRLSAKDNVGKVAGSYPAPGESASGSKSITLYRGMDADSVKKALSNVDDGYGYTGTWGSPFNLAGRYCTKAGDCLTFKSQTPNSQAYAPSLYQTEGSTSPFKDDNYYGESGTMMVTCDAAQQPYCSSDKAQYLVNGGTGALELFPQRDLTSTMCGGKPAGDVIGQVCVNGKLQTITDWNSFPQSSGSTYEMDDFYVVFPVGADLDQLKSDGYFDDAALKDAQGKPAVDTTRPFILARDKSQYSSTSASADGMNATNPFLPYSGYGDDSHVKMKPAPTDDNVYYLVENSDLDWDSLPDATVSTSPSPSASASASASSSASASATLDQSMMKNVTGSYVFPSSGMSQTELTVNADGTFTGYYDSVDEDKNIQSTPQSEWHRSPFRGTFLSIAKNDAGGYDLQCDATALKIEMASGDSSDPSTSAGIYTCGTWHWYPANTPFSSMKSKNGDVKASIYGPVKGDSWPDPILINEDGDGTFLSNWS
ncbi:PASTA domain-containing protein [Bifidobacterium avesanii]|uniref:PASTA domain-containing protein n=1 Tax=Bifidobacterium avesanii TaxID=1798157 RepID=A0A7K3TK22_9BIFI|nr:PASTA domain-containing protein [Bifidobacterium avesanii]KAB8292035.1 serine/threonine protein kinase [Bifidobacterium avesanii]NEG78603.1 PASTA domain-containing protein [Bifidobacterium avesanii]